MTQDEIEKYFGDFENVQSMIDAGYSDQLANWLFDEDVTWGDVFTYAGGEAMLVLFEAIEAGSGIFNGGFYGLNGESAGKQVNFSNISWLDDHTEIAQSLEAQYFDDWGNLPMAYGSDGTPYYVPSTYVDTTSKGSFAAGAGIVSGGATVAACIVAEPCGGIVFVIGAIATATGIGVSAWDALSPDVSIFYVYPAIQLPEVDILGNQVDNPARHYHITDPKGVYE